MRRDIVTTVLHVCSNAKCLARFGIVEPVLSLGVVGLLFFGIKGRDEKRQTCLIGEIALDAEGTEQGAEDVFLLTVEIHSEGLDIVHSSEGCLTVGGNKVEVVFGNVANEINVPSLVRGESDICLIVEKVRPVFAFVLQ